MKGRHSRIPAQCADNFISAVSLNCDQGERTYALCLLLRSEADGVADNRPVALQACETVLHSATCDPQLSGEGGNRRPGIIPEQSQQLAVDVIHRVKAWHCPILVPQSSQNASQCHHSVHKWAEI